MPRYVGMDVHKRIVIVCILSEVGKRLLQLRVRCTREALIEFAERSLEPDDHVVLEATTNTWAVVDLLTPYVNRVVVSNPMQTRAIASAKVKTDRIDARVLANLLRSGYLPEVWQPDGETRRLRCLSYRRASLVGDRTAVKNRLHATLAQRLIEVPFSTLFSTKGLGWLQALDLDEDTRQILDSDLRLLEGLDREIERLELQMASLAYQSEPVRLLMTLPGFNMTAAQGLMAAWGDISRFRDADHAASYLGVVPSVRQSASRSYYGRITKQGNSNARWLLVQAAQHVDRNPGPLGVFFRRLAKKKGRNVAVVATARKLAVIAWHMLKNNEPYRYAIPTSTQLKLARLRIRATGQRRWGASRTRTACPKGMRRLPSLAQVYEKEDVRPAKQLTELTPGEVRFLESSGASAFVKQAQQEHYIPRKTSRAKDHRKDLTNPRSTSK